MKKRVLIGSCGGLTGSYLTRQFQKLGCYVIGADAGAKNVTKFFADEFICLPVANSNVFCEELLKALDQYRIDYYVPTHSYEIRKVSENEMWLRSRWNGDFLVSPYETFQKLDDKRYANQVLESIGIPVPRMYCNLADIEEYPVFMKPNIGSGGKSARKVESAILCQEYAKIDPDSSFYACVSGTEYTVDCMFDDKGVLLGYNQRVRVKSMGGAVIVTQNNYDFDILPYLKKLEKSFVFKGCVNFQYILSNGIPYFIDVNLRYASGGLPLTVESGVNVPKIMLDIWQKKPLTEIYSCAANRKIMYRYFSEQFEEPEE